MCSSSRDARASSPSGRCLDKLEHGSYRGNTFEIRAARVTDFRRPLHDDATRPLRLVLGSGTDPHSCFHDEIAIDFPSIGAVVERMRDGLLGPQAETAAHAAAVSVSARDAHAGVTVPFEVSLPATCGECGGRGESWAEPCGHCAGSGERSRAHLFELSVPPGVSDGARFHFVFAPPQTVPTRIEVTVLVA